MEMFKFWAVKALAEILVGLIITFIITLALIYWRSKGEK